MTLAKCEEPLKPCSRTSKEYWWKATLGEELRVGEMAVVVGDGRDTEGVGVGVRFAGHVLVDRARSARDVSALTSIAQKTAPGPGVRTCRPASVPCRWPGWW
ncbi:hypothetical protein M2271_008494 [Streptomyces sp. LBL]|uniref:hypothetical protein n=1 Tax=Streptomyces sp. LBL TaxID=2940562 RepID=UPI002473341B|nr:hypothetical protein [Streptomyces sp. LBL]MDH6630633.1 hypothetical protein [Streptomyces sp. LBL]